MKKSRGMFGYVAVLLLMVLTISMLFTNGFALPLGEAMAYGMLAEQTQGLIIERAIANHFEREEDSRIFGVGQSVDEDPFVTGRFADKQF